MTIKSTAPGGYTIEASFADTRSGQTEEQVALSKWLAMIAEVNAVETDRLTKIERAARLYLAARTAGAFTAETSRDLSKASVRLDAALAAPGGS